MERFAKAGNNGLSGIASTGHMMMIIDCGACIITTIIDGFCSCMWHLECNKPIVAPRPILVHPGRKQVRSTVQKYEGF